MTPQPSTAILFGASGSVGSALAIRLGAAGWNLMLVGRNVDRMPRLQETAAVLVRKIEHLTASEVDACFQEASARFGAIHGVANCMGNLILKPAHLTDDAMWQETLLINLTSSFYILRSAAKSMMSAGGSMVFVSSAAAQTGFANHEAIAAAKAGIEGLVRSAAATYGSKRIRVNAVAPGLVRSHMTRTLVENETSRAVSESMHILGRIGEPDDVAAAIQWLLGPESSWITGQVLGVDGGLAHIRPRPAPTRAPTQARA